MKKLESHDWWPEMVALKDELSLRELGERFGATPGAIMNAFRRNGIEREPAPPGPRANRKRRKGASGGSTGASALPPEPGEADGRRGSKDSQIERFANLLGSVPDRVVAQKAGVSLRTVAAYRARNGIDGYAGPRKAARSGRRSKIDPFAELVGTVSDRVVADKAGVSVNAVRNWRRVRGIAAVGRSDTAEAGSGAIAAAAGMPTVYVDAPFAGSGGIAWRVTLEGGAIGVVVGRTLVEAATQAQNAGSIASLERIGPVLR